MNTKIKLIFLDMEGVIFETGIKQTSGNVAASIWTIIARSLGAHEEDRKGEEIWNSNGFKNHMKWMEYAISVHKKYRLKMRDFYNIINQAQYINGAKETLQILKQKGYITAMITGGFKNLANRAIRDLKIDHTFAACEYFFDDKTGELSHYNLLPCDYEGKVDFMRLLMREHGLKKEECAFVGDGVNDIPLAREVGLSIAFNAREELQKVCTFAINQKEKDLRSILQFF